MKKLKRIFNQFDKKQIIIKKAQKSIKGGFWGDFVYRGGGQCHLCIPDNLDI